MELLANIWEWYLVADEYVGLVVGVLIVLCLIRENLWAWPLGVLFVIISITVLRDAQLYGYLALNLVGFLPLNLYGWYYWLFGTDQKTELAVTRVHPRVLIVLAVLCVVGVLVLPYIFDVVFTNYEDAAYIHWDNSIFMLSFAAMWLTAKKKIENWIVWFIVNVLTVGIYAAQGLWAYMILYVIYIGLAVWGYIEWQKSMLKSTAALAEGSQ